MFTERLDKIKFTFLKKCYCTKCQHKSIPRQYEMKRQWSFACKALYINACSEYNNLDPTWPLSAKQIGERFRDRARVNSEMQ